MATATVSIVVPALPDSDVWFANNAAWSTYWHGLTADVTLDAAVTTLYIPQVYDNSIVPAVIDIDGVPFALVTVAMLTSLMAQLNNLDISYRNLRSELRDAGYITTAQ